MASIAWALQHHQSDQEERLDDAWQQHRHTAASPKKGESVTGKQLTHCSPHGTQILALKSKGSGKEHVHSLYLKNKVGVCSGSRQLSLMYPCLAPNTGNVACRNWPSQFLGTHHVDRLQRKDSHYSYIHTLTHSNSINLLT